MAHKHVYIGSINNPPEFKGEETVREWERTIEGVLLAMSLSTDKRGLRLYVDVSDACISLDKLTTYIRENMNTDSGPCTIIPGNPRNDD